MAEDKAEQGRMVAYEDFKPKSADVRVGTDARPMVVRELSIAKRDAVVKVLVEDAKLLATDSPLMEALRGAGRAAIHGDDAGAEVMNAAFVRGVTELATKIVGSTLSTLSCLVLDCKENRIRAGVAAEAAVSEHKLGFEHCPAMWAWLQSEMTMRQEQAVIEAAIDVNDFAALVGKYLAVARKAVPGKAPKAPKAAAETGATT
jgi:hypothetical protein